MNGLLDSSSNKEAHIAKDASCGGLVDSSSDEEAPRIKDAGTGIEFVQVPPPVCYLEPRNIFFPCTLVLAGYVTSVRIQQVYAITQNVMPKPDFTVRGVLGSVCSVSCVWESEKTVRIGHKLRLLIRYNQLTSKHQHRPFALRIQAQCGSTSLSPMVVGCTRVRTRKPRPRLPKTDAPVVEKVRTAEELADARQRMAEERGEVCDLTSEEPPAKHAKR